MNPYLKRFLFVILILLLLLIGGAFLVATAFQDAIGQRIVQAINGQITTELKVDDFQLSLVRSFPNAAIALKGVEVTGANRDLLLDAGEVSFRIGYASVFGGSIQVNSVRIANGALWVRIDEQGRANYDIAKPADGEAPAGAPSDISISLKKALLENIFLVYDNDRDDQHTSVSIQSLDLSGEFSAQAFELKTKGELQSNFLDLAGIRYLPGKQIGIDALLDVDLDKGSYDFRQFDLQVEKNLFQLDGVLTTRPDGTLFDLFVTNESGHLDDLVQLLPQQYLDRLGNLSSKGDFFFEGRIDGLLSDRANPDIHFKFGLQRGKIDSDLLPSGLRDVSFEARFTNGRARSNASSEFEIEDFQGLFGRQPVDFHLLVRDLDDPLIDLSLDGVLPIETVTGMLGSASVRKASGEIEIQQFALQGRYSDMVRPERMGAVQAQGRIEFDDASLTFESERLTLDRGVLEVRGNELVLDNLKLEGAGSDIVLDGSCANLLPVLLADTLTEQSPRLRIEANWRSENLDIDRFLGAIASTAPAQAEPAVHDTLLAEPTSPQPAGWFASRLDGVFECQIKQFNYGKVEGKYFLGKLTFEGNTLHVEGNAEAMGGRFNLYGNIALEEQLRLQARLDCADVDVKEFFRQTDNFGQTVLQDRHLEGTLSSRIALFADFDENANLLLDDLLVFAGIGIQDGELRDFELLKDLSSFVKVEDLEHIRFNNMENYLEIKDQRLYLPAMFIQSNAMNLTISGEHSFDNEIDYNIKVNAGQVLANKFKKHNPDLEPIKAKGGLVNLYFRIYGTVDEFEYKTAKREVKRDFDSSEARKREIQAALRQAFGDIALIREPENWGDTGEPAVLEGF